MTELPISGVTFFGPPWDAPMLDPEPDGSPGAEQVATPVGHVCYSCGEQIVDGDRGLMRLCAIRTNNAGVIYNTIEPIHTECSLLEILGHQYRVCSCTGRGVDRAAALEVLAAHDRERAAAGMAPLFGEPVEEPAPTEPDQPTEFERLTAELQASQDAQAGRLIRRVP